jgi:hypothetical protein
MSGKSPQSIGSARAWAVKAARPANASRGTIFIGVLHRNGGGQIDPAIHLGQGWAFEPVCEPFLNDSIPG